MTQVGTFTIYLLLIGTTISNCVEEHIMMTSEDHSKPIENSEPETKCLQMRHHAMLEGRNGMPLIGAYVPQCDTEGNFVPKQCSGSTGYCWCVDTDGDKLQGNEFEVGPGKELDCKRAEKEPLTKCLLMKQKVLSKMSNGMLMVGAYIPQCDTEGNFVPKQCSGSTGYCWCVDTDGDKLPGNEVGPGKELDCKRTGKEEVCNLSSESGPCKAYFEMWYFDPKDKSCKMFVYGGCKGNANRFDSRERCEKYCMKSSY